MHLYFIIVAVIRHPLYVKSPPKILSKNTGADKATLRSLRFSDSHRSAEITYYNIDREGIDKALFTAIDTRLQRSMFIYCWVSFCFERTFGTRPINNEIYS